MPDPNPYTAPTTEPVATAGRGSPVLRGMAYTALSCVLLVFRFSRAPCVAGTTIVGAITFAIVGAGYGVIVLMSRSKPRAVRLVAGPGLFGVNLFLLVGELAAAYYSMTHYVRTH